MDSALKPAFSPVSWVVLGPAVFFLGTTTPTPTSTLFHLSVVRYTNSHFPTLLYTLPLLFDTLWLDKEF